MRCLIIYSTVARPPCTYSMGLSCYNTYASPVSTSCTPALTALMSSEASILRTANVRPFERPGDRGRNRIQSESRADRYKPSKHYFAYREPIEVAVDSQTQYSDAIDVVTMDSEICSTIVPAATGPALGYVVTFYYYVHCTALTYPPFLRCKRT